ncbi:MAG: hypothetical protein UY68_C0003G0036 [Parcubacteria group bacterium GW2011_GWF2_52_12]|nr:MAG: hypothetical protein UY68_C0003G0036 [Parcubacteria group bacterium GW2011_GWF2_52_12]
MKISPLVFESGKESTFVVVFLPRYLRLRVRMRSFPTKTSESSYPRPRTCSAADANSSCGAGSLVRFPADRLIPFAELLQPFNFCDAGDALESPLLECEA